MNASETAPRSTPLRYITASTAYRWAVGVAIAAAFIHFWLSLAVGILGADGAPADLMYVGVFAVGVIGAIIARFQPLGMARVLVAMAVAEALVAVIALIAAEWFPAVWREATGMQQANPASEILGLNGFFIALFLGSAWLFRQAAREKLAAGGPREAREG